MAGPGVNWLDRAIGFVAPGVGAARIEARARMARGAVIRNAYDAASRGRRTDGWRAVSTDANAETYAANGRLRDVVRDLVRNNAWAARAKSVIANNAVGSGIVLAVTGKTPARKAKVKQLLTDHLESTAIDADGRLNIYGLQNLAMATIVEAGEVLIRRRVRRAEDGLVLPLQLQLLEPDFLDTNVDGVLPGGNYAVQGVEFDLRGQRVAYYLFDQHPGSMQRRGSFRGTRVSADYVAHIYRVDRPGQVRGVTWYAPIIPRLHDLADLSDAQILKQKIAACFAGYIKDNGLGGDYSGAASGQGDQADGGGYPIENLEPGIIERLGYGEDITFTNPPSTQDFGPYAQLTLREIAVGMNIPYEAMTGDLSSVNFSSGRMGWLEFQRAIESWRWNMLMPGMMQPILRWADEAIRVVTMSTEPYRVDCTPPRREMIDPDSEIKSATSAIRAGLSSRSNEIRKLGYEPDAIDAEIAADNARADTLALVLDSDPRKTSGAGMMQASAGAVPPPVNPQ